MADLIITDNKAPIDQILLDQKEAYGEVSKRYIPIATQQVIDMAKEFDSNVEVIGFNKAKVRKEEKEGFQKHAVMLQFSNAEMLDGTKLNMVIYNSNDRSSSLKLYTGFLRMVCSNQCVVGDQIAEPISIKHTNLDWQDKVKYSFDTLQETKLRTEEMIDRMLNQYTSYGDMGRYAEQVANMMNNHITGSIVDPLELLVSHRPEDNGKDLWHTYQRIQYNVMNGGIQRQIPKQDDEGRVKALISKTHKITDDSLKIKWNRELNEMAMDLL